MPEGVNLEGMDPRFKRVVEAFSRHGDVTLGWNMGSPNLKVSGKPFAYFDTSERILIARVSAETINGMANRGEGEPWLSEWIGVRGKSVDWVAIAEQAYEHVRFYV